MDDKVRLVNLLKRLMRLADDKNNYDIKAVAEEVNVSVLKLLKSKD